MSVRPLAAVLRRGLISGSATDRHRIVKLRSYIAGSLWIGGLLLTILVVSAVLWGVLSIAGDGGGAQGARAVFLVALGCWLLDFVALVVLLALVQLASLDDED